MKRQLLSAALALALWHTATADPPAEIKGHDGLVYSVEKTMSENKDKLDATAASDLEAAIAESKTALAGEDASAMDNAFEKLQTASHKLAEALYQQAPPPGAETPGSGQASAAGASSTGTTGEDNVIDAEYVDVEDNK